MVLCCCPTGCGYVLGEQFCPTAQKRWRARSVANTKGLNDLREYRLTTHFYCLLRRTLMLEVFRSQTAHPVEMNTPFTMRTLCGSGLVAFHHWDRSSRSAFPTQQLKERQPLLLPASRILRDLRYGNFLVICGAEAEAVYLHSCLST